MVGEAFASSFFLLFSSIRRISAMNLQSIREKIKNITDYSPDLQQFNDQLDELVNDAYYSLWTMKRWNFATKLGLIKFYPDMTPSRDDDDGSGDVNANIVAGSRFVQFSASMDRLVGDVWEGQPIQIQTQEYTINKVVSESRLLLTEEFMGTTNTDDVSWKIKKRWYDLPEDCLELLYIGHRDYPYTSVAGSQNPYGKSTAILPRKEESFNMRVDYAMSYAEAYITCPDYRQKPGEICRLEQSSDASADIPTGKTFEICWAFYKDGKVGALSNPDQVTLGAGGGQAITVNFDGWDNDAVQYDGFETLDKKPPQWEGYQKKIYWNKNFNQTTGQRTGLPCWLEIVNGGTTRNTEEFLEAVKAEDADASYQIKFINQFNNGSKRYIERDGVYQQIRPYPRVDGFDFEVPKEVGGTVKHDYVRQGVIRYLKKPQDMVLGTDVPEMPVEFHQLIVYKALEDIYLKLGNEKLARIYEKKYGDEVKNLEKRYVDKIDFKVQRGQFGFTRGFRGYDVSDLNYGG